MRITLVKKIARSSMSNVLYTHFNILIIFYCFGLMNPIIFVYEVRRAKFSLFSLQPLLYVFMKRGVQEIAMIISFRLIKRQKTFQKSTSNREILSLINNK